MQQVLQQMDRHFSSPLALVAQVVRRSQQVELMQVTADLPKFQVEELLLLLQLVVAAVVMVTQQVHLVDQVVVAVVMALADPALWVKVI
jgi:hypothetical protein